MEFFEKFEEERRQVSQTLDDLQTEVIELSVVGDNSSDEINLPQIPIPKDMFDYYMAFSREGASEENTKRRAEIMYHRMLDFLDHGHNGR